MYWVYAIYNYVDLYHGYQTLSWRCHQHHESFFRSWKKSWQVSGKQGRWSLNFNYIFYLKTKMKKVRQSFDPSMNKCYAYQLSSCIYHWFVRNYIWGERGKIYQPTNLYKNGTKWALFRKNSILISLWQVKMHN